MISNISFKNSQSLNKYIQKQLKLIKNPTDEKISNLATIIYQNKIIYSKFDKRNIKLIKLINEIKSKTQNHDLINQLTKINKIATKALLTYFPKSCEMFEKVKSVDPELYWMVLGEYVNSHKISINELNLKINDLVQLLPHLNYIRFKKNNTIQLNEILNQIQNIDFLDISAIQTNLNELANWITKNNILLDHLILTDTQFSQLITILVKNKNEADIISILNQTKNKCLNFTENKIDLKVLAKWINENKVNLSRIELREDQLKELLPSLTHIHVREKSSNKIMKFLSLISNDFEYLDLLYATVDLDSLANWIKEKSIPLNKIQLKAQNFSQLAIHLFKKSENEENFLQILNQIKSFKKLDLTGLNINIQLIADWINQNKIKFNKLILPEKQKDELLNHLTYLEVKDKDEHELAKIISKARNLVHLNIAESEIGSALEKCSEKLESLIIFECENIVLFPGNLPHLKTFSLCLCNSNQPIPNTWTQLENLSISLNDLFNQPIPSEFIALKSLTINKCINWNQPLPKDLNHLKELSINHCPAFKQKIQDLPKEAMLAIPNQLDPDTIKKLVSEFSESEKETWDEKIMFNQKQMRTSDFLLLAYELFKTTTRENKTERIPQFKEIFDLYHSLSFKSFAYLAEKNPDLLLKFLGDLTDLQHAWSLPLLKPGKLVDELFSRSLSQQIELLRYTALEQKVYYLQHMDQNLIWKDLNQCLQLLEKNESRATEELIKFKLSASLVVKNLTLFLNSLPRSLQNGNSDNELETLTANVMTTYRQPLETLEKLLEKETQKIHSQKGKEEEIPEEYVDPITGEVMKNPCTLQIKGKTWTYDYGTWEKCEGKHPETRESFKMQDLKENNKLLMQIKRDGYL